MSKRRLEHINPAVFFLTCLGFYGKNVISKSRLPGAEMRP